ncbi:hypothetical protein HPB52_001794 [Rhipicephalus sanguineus]|uniref:Uncharacterized protein n=1 Tax=Rhipicephalus sanguineus TaxID=34632 RepID=A0A9D4QCT2_RHISA|nr:hypothetical protein HPB52_001794 [Rhipicephalus sanguineus]
MEYSVEGEVIDPVELNYGTWQHPKGSTDPLDPLDLQKRFGRKKTDISKPTAKLGLTGASAPEDYKIVLRPKSAVELSSTGIGALLESIHSTVTIDVMQADQVDQTSKGTTTNANSHAQTRTATVDSPSCSRQRTQETFRDRSGFFPPLLGEEPESGKILV